MVWTSNVITHRLRRVSSAKDRSRMPDTLRDRVILIRHDLYMFRRQLIHNLARLIQGLHHNDRSILVQRRQNDLTPWQQLRLPFHFLHYILRQPLTRRNQNRRRVFTMFCLGQQIRSNKIRPPHLVCYNHNLRRPGNRIDSHDSKHELLSRRDKLVAWSGYFIYTRHSLSSERKGRDRVRAANRINPRYVKLQQCRGDCGTLRQRPWRRRHNDSINSGDLRGHDVHYHRRRISSRSSRHVQTNSLEGRNPLAQLNTFARTDGPRLFNLTLVKFSDILDRLTKRTPHPFINSGSRALQLI